jgi:hypothetical protein
MTRATPTLCQLRRPAQVRGVVAGRDACHRTVVPCLACELRYQDPVGPRALTDHVFYYRGRSPGLATRASAVALARRIEITHAPGGSRTISGSTVEQGGAPAGGAG